MNTAISFTVLLLISNAVAEECDKCVARALCEAFELLNLQQQALWQDQYPCFPNGNAYSGHGGPSVENYVCCSDHLRRLVESTRGNYQSPGYNQDLYNNMKGIIQAIYSLFNGTSPRMINPPHPGDQNNIGPREQCPLTSFPQDPETGCCGREASDDDRIAAPNTAYAASSNFHDDQHWGHPAGGRLRRSDDNENITITIEDRIAGGKETELSQFPWTVQLQTTFDYGDEISSFDCGGSLISALYVLTAAHCVFHAEGKLTKVEVFLAEYDMRTYPIDCKIKLGLGETCVENVLIDGESVIIHPQYDNKNVKNDIALIRLVDFAPYTEYIRPICLPSINLDKPEFSDLPLAVAGWGYNGNFRSDIKQFTVVNLVPQETCQPFYESLSESQLCAAGLSGEDICKGDSGGPLMTVYGGKYEVVGIVSGKRADAPCGTAVPSLYTNVYQYLDWIRSNIKN